MTNGNVLYGRTRGRIGCPQVGTGVLLPLRPSHICNIRHTESTDVREVIRVRVPHVPSVLRPSSTDGRPTRPPGRLHRHRAARMWPEEAERLVTASDLALLQP